MSKEEIVEYNKSLGIETYFYNDIDSLSIGYTQDNKIYLNEAYDIELLEKVNKHEVLHKFENSKEFKEIKETLLNSSVLNMEELRKEYSLKYAGVYTNREINKGILDNEIIIDYISSNLELPVSIDEVIKNAYEYIVSKGEIEYSHDRKYMNITLSTKIEQQYKDFSKWDKLFILNYYDGKKHTIPSDKRTRKEVIKQTIHDEYKRLVDLKNNPEYFKIDPHSEEVLREYESQLKASVARGEDIEHYKSNKEGVLSTLATNIGNRLYEEYKHLATYIESTNYEESFKYLLLNETLTKVYKSINAGNEQKKSVQERKINESIQGHMSYNDDVLKTIYENIDNYSNFANLYYAGLEIHSNKIAQKNGISLDDVETYGKGRWIKFEGKTSNNEKYLENAKSLSALVKDTPWCTRSLAAQHLATGDFYVFVDNSNKCHIAVKMRGDEIDEVRGIENGNLQELEVEYRDVAESFLLNNKDIKNAKEWIEKEEWNKRLIKYANGEEADIRQLEYDLFEFEDYKSHGGNTHRDRAIKYCVSHPEYLKESYKDFMLKALDDNIYNFEYIPEELKNDEDVILKVIGKDMLLINGFPNNLRNNKDFILRAVKVNCFALKYASDSLKDDKEVVLKAIENNADAIKYASDRLKDNKEVMLKAVEHDGNALMYAFYLRDDKEVVLKAIENNIDAIKYASDRLKHDKDVILKIMEIDKDSDISSYFTDELKDDKEVMLIAVENNGFMLKYASDKLKDDKDIVLKAVNQNGLALIYASDRLKNDKEVVLKAIESNTYAIEYASDELKKDKDIILKLIEKDGNGFVYPAYFTDELKDDKEFMLKAIERNALLLIDASNRLKDDKDVVLKAVNKNGSALIYDSDRLKNDKDVVLKAIESNVYAIEYASDELKKDKDIILKFIEKDANAYSYYMYIFNNKLDDDREFISKAIEVNARVLMYASDRLQDDKEIVLKAVENSGSSLMYASKRLRDDKEVVLKAVENNGVILECASDRLKDDREVVLKAIENSGSALICASKRLRDDKEIALKAIEKRPDLLKNVSEKLRNDKEVVLKAVEKSGFLLEYASDELKNNAEVVLKSIETEIYALSYASKELKGNKEFMLKAVEINVNALSRASFELINDKDVILKAVGIDGTALRYTLSLGSDKEVALKAIENNAKAIKYVSTELRNSREFLLDAVKCNSEVFNLLSDDEKKIVSKDIQALKKIKETREIIKNDAMETLINIKTKKKENNSKR